MSTIYRQNLEHVAERRIRDEAVLLPITSDVGGLGKMYDMNATATLIWDLARDGVSEEAVLRHFLETFDGDEAQMRADVRAILAHLQEIGALVAEA